MAAWREVRQRKINEFSAKITLCLFLHVTLCGGGLAQVAEIPDPNLRAAISDTLNLPQGDPITLVMMQQLRHFDAPEKGIRNLTGLEHAINLELLALGGNEISNLTPIANLVKLEELWLWGNPMLSDLSPIANLTRLEYLVLAGCQVSDLRSLSKLTQLRKINLDRNRIVDISPLANLARLTELVISENEVGDIGPLANLTRLTESYLDRNVITDVRPLASLTRLERLEIQHNEIVDHSPLDILSLVHFEYDQTCEMAPIPLEARLESRSSHPFLPHGAENTGVLL